MAEDRKPSSEFREKDERVSLAPLDPEDALRALLAVKPADDPAVPSEHEGPQDRSSRD